MQPSEGKPVSKSSSYSSLSSVNKQSVDESLPMEDKHASMENQVVFSPALSKTSVASSEKLAVEQNLEAEKNITMSDNENKDEKATSTSSTASKLNSTSKVSVTSHLLPSTDQVNNSEHVLKHNVMDVYPDAPLGTSKPSLMASSLDKQMAELQEALRAAGLPPIDSNINTVNVAPVSTENEPMVRSSSDLPEDIEEVLRELATQEVVSLSRKILHEKQTELEKAETEKSQTVSQQSQTAQNHQVKIPLGDEKFSKEIHVPLSDCNVFSSSENLLAEIGSFKNLSTQSSSDEAPPDTKHTTSVTRKKNLFKPNAKRENVFQRLSAPKSNPAVKKPPAAKRVTPKSTRRSRVSTYSSQKKEKQSTFDGQGTYDLKSNTELILDHTAKLVRNNYIIMYSYVSCDCVKTHLHSYMFLHRNWLNLKIALILPENKSYFKKLRIGRIPGKKRKISVNS